MCTINRTERKIIYEKNCLKFPKFFQLKDEKNFIFLFTFEDTQTLSWLGKYLYKSFLIRVSACSSELSAVPCAAMHLPVTLSFLSHPWNHVLNLFSFFNDLSKQCYEFYILCVFLWLPVFNCHTYSAFHQVRMSSFYVVDTVCFHVLIHELVTVFPSLTLGQYHV